MLPSSKFNLFHSQHSGYYNSVPPKDTFKTVSNCYMSGVFNCIKVVSFPYLSRTHVTAAIIHGYGPYAFIDVHSWPHDSNLTIHVSMEILRKRDFLPPILYLQLDNTARENKNQYLLSFLSYLVQVGVFSEVIFLWLY